jgi:hypothetical protein
MRNIIIFTVHKAASMLLYRLAKHVSMKAGIQFYSVNDGTLPPKVEDPIIFKKPNSCFCPIRFYAAVPDIENYHIILHLRDPRDVLTSLFFLHAYSHPRSVDGFNPSDDRREKWIGNGIDEFVIENSATFLDRYNEYCDKLLDKENVIFLKYEHMVASFDGWFCEFISVFPLKQKTDVVNQIIETSESFFNIKEENKYNHKRQIWPGDHKRKLKAETIEILSKTFEKVLTTLDYSLS